MIRVVADHLNGVGFDLHISLTIRSGKPISREYVHFIDNVLWCVGNGAHYSLAKAWVILRIHNGVSEEDLNILHGIEEIEIAPFDVISIVLSFVEVAIMIGIIGQKNPFFRWAETERRWTNYQQENQGTWEELFLSHMFITSIHRGVGDFWAARPMFSSQQILIIIFSVVYAFCDSTPASHSTNMRSMLISRSGGVVSAGCVDASRPAASSRGFTRRPTCVFREISVQPIDG